MHLAFLGVSRGAERWVTMFTVFTIITVFPVFTASVPHCSLDGGKVYLAAEQFALSVLAQPPQHHPLGRLKLSWRSQEGQQEEGELRWRIQDE